MVRSAGTWVDGGVTCEIFEVATGQTFVAAYEDNDQRAARIKLIKDFASEMKEEDETCGVCGHVFEEYTGKGNGWFHIRSHLTCGHSICVVCQLELVATSLDHSLDGTCLPHDTFDKISGNVIPACIFGRQCTKAKLVCPSCETIDTRNITEIPKDLGFEHVRVKGFNLHDLVQQRLKPVKRQRVKAQNTSAKRQKTNETLQHADEEDGVYIVERIVSSKVLEGEELFLVRWKGYQPEDDTWEPAEHFADPSLIELFNQTKEHMRSSVRASGMGLVAADVGEAAKFKLDGIEDDALIEVRVQQPVSGVIEGSVVRQSSCSHEIEYVAKTTGQHSVEVVVAGEPVEGSPFQVEVTAGGADPAKCDKGEKPWMQYKACHRSKICRLLGDCVIRHPAENPKRPGSVAAQRWEKYKEFKYVWEMFRHGFGSDVSYQLRRGQGRNAHLHIEMNANES